MMKSTDKLTTLVGVGDKMAARFLRLGIETIEDMLRYYPKDYERYEAPLSVLECLGQVEKYSAYREEEKALGKHGVVSVYGQVLETVKLIKKGSLTVAIGTACDIFNHKFQVIWYNQPYMRANVKAGESYVFRGRVSLKSRNLLQLEQPEVFKKEKYDTIQGKMLPIYPLTAGISRKLFLKCMQQILENLSDFHYNDNSLLPDAWIEEEQLPSAEEALRFIHFPNDRKDYEKARKRIAFEEFFVFALRMQFMKNRYAGRKNCYPRLCRQEAVDRLLLQLPYSLTAAQTRVLCQVREDMTGAYTMHRLIQGDVGSGKTILAFLMLYEVALSGYQGFMMAPTEVLAKQHYQGLCKLFEEHGICLPVGYLVGSMTAGDKQKVKRQIADGKLLIVIGTHALFQDSVTAQKLALVITDEQHRFGVDQREKLTHKGVHPHVCVMSATPIPRTLGMILYGDLDISVLDEKPARRLPIKSCVVDVRYRQKAYRFIEEQVQSGHQAYIVCPMVEESELMSGENVLDYAKMLQNYYSGRISVGILHGRMSAQEKNEVMSRFQSGQLSILVSTVVIEVGVDVPNATVMMIEDAQRFGLAQLHQLRGRVGRGSAQSYCIFIRTTEDTEENDRLSVLQRSEDGFYIAEEDLRLRGPGDFNGVRQSGELIFSLGDLYSDHALFQKAVASAQKYMDNLSSDEIKCLEQKLQAYIFVKGNDKLTL